MKTNKAGNEVPQRIYWSNQNTNILSDVAAEASLERGQWGHLVFHAEGSGASGQPTYGSTLLDDDAAAGNDVTEEDLL